MCFRTVKHENLFKYIPKIKLRLCKRAKCDPFKKINTFFHYTV